MTIRPPEPQLYFRQTASKLCPAATRAGGLSAGIHLTNHTTAVRFQTGTDIFLFTAFTVARW
jgi:hypothetical protein